MGSLCTTEAEQVTPPRADLTDPSMAENVDEQIERERNAACDLTFSCRTLIQG